MVRKVTAFDVLILLLVLALGYVLVSQLPGERVAEVVREHRLAGAVLFAFVMFGTTVIAPLASLPLVPVLAPILGPFTTGLSVFLGWTLGAFVAFWIGRRYGRPVAGRFVNLETLGKYETHLTPETGFFLIVALRMLLPVDVLSYALGIFTRVSFPVYALATMFGIVWFSFAFAYLGAAASEANYVLLGGISVASVVILGFSWRIARKILKR